MCKNTSVYFDVIIYKQKKVLLIYNYGDGNPIRTDEVWSSSCVWLIMNISWLISISHTYRLLISASECAYYVCICINVRTSLLIIYIDMRVKMLEIIILMSFNIVSHHAYGTLAHYYNYIMLSFWPAMHTFLSYPS